jgi:molecular chaperone GrpE
MRGAMHNSDIENGAAASGPENPAAEPASDDRARLEAENAELKDRALRVMAEMENLRKRTEREVQDARAYAVSAFARDLLTVADNLDRALAAVPSDDEDPALKALVDGVGLTGREFQGVLAKHGVTRIEPQAGERFDPNLHQAMFEVPDPSRPTGEVVQVIQPGFAISGRLLRPAMVGVSKGGPKPQAEAGASVDRSA